MYNEEMCRQKAAELVGKMTIEEKAGQLLYNSPAVERLGIPAYNWWNEALHGVARAGTATVFPQAIGLAATFDIELVGQIADAISTEGRAKYNENSKHGDRDLYKGLSFWAPNINIFRDQRWGRGHETYGEDPFLTAEIGKSFIRHMQGEGEVMKTAACAKHFAVHSGPEDLRHEFDAVVSKKDLWETYLPAFEACVTEAKVESVMGAYNRTNGEVCCASQTLLKDILRDKWNFKGHIVSDYEAVTDFHMHHKITATPQESAALALKAGCDLNCGKTYIHLMEAYHEGNITEEDIDHAAINVFATRYKLGLFDGSEYDEIPYEKVECKEHLELSEKAAAKSCVLLKNNGVLPLKKEELLTIGVIGPNANSRRALKGNYYGTSSRYITILEGIQDEAGDDIRVLYSKGCELVSDRTESLAMEKDRLAEAQTVAEHSDVVILCLGLDETLEGEEMDEGNHVGSGDKADLELPAMQKELLEKMTATGKKIILCLMAGSSLNIAYAKEHCDGILLAWYPGARGGKGVADILFGRTSPCGKLPVTFYETLDDLPEFTDYSMKNRTYRYYQGRPLYPFGYGLTYAKVSCTDIKMESEDEKFLILKIKIKNSCACKTEDTIQIYIKNKTSHYAPPNPVLCGFVKVELDSNEHKDIVMKLDKKVLQVVNENGERIIDGNSYLIYAATSAPDEISSGLTGEKPVVLEYAL